MTAQRGRNDRFHHAPVARHDPRPRDPRRRPDRRDDPAGEGRPAVRRVGRARPTRAAKSPRTSTRWRSRSTWTRCCRTGSGSSPGPSAPPPSTPRSARCRCCAPSAASPRQTASASRPSPTRSASPASPPGARPPTPSRCPGARPSIRRWYGAWPRPSGSDMRSVGVHQGLAPVLDVVRDARWGRVEETIGEDPYLVGTLATAYVQGLESAGIVATLKHFAGYSASRAGRNLAPVGMGPRERADVMLPPFEMALREGGARSVMHAYTDTDGVPSAADEQLLTGLLRDTWGFTGTVVADYFGVAFLKTLHGVAGTLGRGGRSRAERRAWTWNCPPSRRSGSRCSTRSRTVGCPRRWWTARCAACSCRRRSLACSTPDWDAVPPALAGAGLGGPRGAARHRGPGHRGPTATSPGEVAEQAVVLLRNDGTLPLAAARQDRAGRPRRRHRDGRPRLLRLPRARRAPGTPRYRSASNCPPCVEALSGRVPGQRGRHRTRVRHRRQRHRRFRRGGASWPVAPTSSSSRSATAPGSSAGAPAARAATPSRSRCRACSSSSSTHCWTPAHRSW